MAYGGSDPTVASDGTVDYGTSFSPSSQKVIDDAVAAQAQPNQWDQFAAAPQPTASPKTDPWEQYKPAPPTVVGGTSGIATNFADQNDLSRYRQAKSHGASEDQALKVGDNGVGHPDLGGVDTPNTYGVAIPRDQLIANFGPDPQAWRTARAQVYINGQEQLVPFVDVGPGKGPQLRGVVADLTAPLSKAVGGTGSDQVAMKFIANAGPDYVNNKAAWYKEQQQIAANLPGSAPWSKFAVAGQPQAQDESAWDKFPVAPPDVQRAEPAAAGTESYGATMGAERAAPPPPTADDLVTTFGKSIQNIWQSALEATAQINKGGAQSEINQPSVENDPYNLQIQETKVNPDLNDEQKAQMIQALQQKQADYKAQTPELLAKAQADIKAAEAAKPDAEFQKSIPGQISGFIGGAVPYVAAGATGPMSPFIAAQQMTASAYGDALDSAMDLSKKVHPEWDDTQRLTESLKVAADSAKARGLGGLALGFVDVPVVGPLIGRMVAKVGIGAATMATANVLARVQENLSLQRNIDPTLDITQGLLDEAKSGAGQGALFAVPHALGEIGRGHVATPEAKAAPEPLPEAKVAPQPNVEAAQGVPEPQATNLKEEAKPSADAEAQAAEPSNAQPTPQPESEVRQPEAKTVAPMASETDPWVSAIANRFTSERSASGEIGEIAPGEGYSTTDLLQAGLRMSPEDINKHVSDLMHNTGDPMLQAAAIRAEEARLSQRSSQLSEISELDPGNVQAKTDAENAFKDLTDFHNGPVAKLKNNWHAQGMTLQGENPVDLSTFNGLREAWLKDVGTTPSDQVLETMRRTASKVRDSITAENGAMDNLGKRIDESTVNGKYPSPEEVRNNIMERMKDDPCLVA